jgi:hypothetical protein
VDQETARVSRFRFVCLCAAVVLVLAGLLLLWFSAAGPSGTGDSVFLLSDRSIDQILRLRIKNRYDDYTVWQEGGGFVVEDLPMEQVNPEYVRMLLEESARVEYGALVPGGADGPALYGLDKPEAEITIDYTDGERLTLLPGNEETVSSGRYFMAAGTENVLLMKNNRARRSPTPRVRSALSAFCGPCRKPEAKP